MKRFILETDSDPDLNGFTECEFEANRNSRWGHLSANEVDSIQRWMRDAKPGDRRPIGKTAFVCIEHIE